MNRKLYLLALICWLWLSACNSPTPVLPTLAPVAAVPTQPPPTPTSLLPPTLDLTAIVPTLVPTTVSTPRPTLTPTPVVALLNLTEPKKGDVLLLGSSVEARGLIQLDQGQSIRVDLLSANGRLLNSVPGAVGDIGWEATVDIPIFVSGAALLQASIRDEADNVVAQNQVELTLVPDTENAEQYLVLLRPEPDEKAVGGFNMFFDGRILRPTNSLITIAIWTDNCQTEATKQSFTLGRSVRAIYWQGFAIPPHNAVGEACAVARTGEPGAADWREAVVPITIYAPEDAEAKGVTIGNPPPETTIVAGEELFFNGTALNVSEELIRLSIVLENGQILFEGEIETDFWGYWEQSIFVPIDIEGAAEVTVFTQPDDGNDYAEAKMTITIEPAPTPTPFAP